MNLFFLVLGVMSGVMFTRNAEPMPDPLFSASLISVAIIGCLAYLVGRREKRQAVAVAVATAIAHAAAQSESNAAANAQAIVYIDSTKDGENGDRKVIANRKAPIIEGSEHRQIARSSNSADDLRSCFSHSRNGDAVANDCDEILNAAILSDSGTSSF